MSVYEDLVDSLMVQERDKIWLSSNIVQFAMTFKKNGMKFECELLLDAIENRVGNEGTILIPVFNWNIDENDVFNVKTTKGVTGALGNVAINRKNYLRTRHPMHSFMVWGKDRDYLCNMTNESNFGSDSPFEYCKNENVKQIMLGTDFTHSMTFVHYVEVMCKVPYRERRSFNITYCDYRGLTQNREYVYFPKKDKYPSVEKFERIGSVLLKNGCAKKVSFLGIDSIIVNLGDSYQWIENDVMHNQCKRLFDFTVDREMIFKNYY